MTCLSSQLIKRRGRDFLLEHSPALHVELRGLSRSRAILQFIREAGGLPDASVTVYRMRQVSDTDSGRLKKTNPPANSALNLLAGEERAEKSNPFWCDSERSPYLSGRDPPHQFSVHFVSVHV